MHHPAWHFDSICCSKQKSQTLTCSGKRTETSWVVEKKSKHKMVFVVPVENFILNKKYNEVNTAMHVVSKTC
jgi:hypothetical protein